MTPIEPQYCGLHEVYEKWHEERWIEMQKRIDNLQKVCDKLEEDLVGMKLFLTKISIFLVVAMALVQFFAPVIWRALGVK